jgi:hypothetical protein
MAQPAEARTLESRMSQDMDGSVAPNGSLGVGASLKCRAWQRSCNETIRQSPMFDGVAERRRPITFAAARKRQTD